MVIGIRCCKLATRRVEKEVCGRIRGSRRSDDRRLAIDQSHELTSELLRISGSETFECHDATKRIECWGSGNWSRSRARTCCQRIGSEYLAGCTCNQGAQVKHRASLFFDKRAPVDWSNVFDGNREEDFRHDIVLAGLNLGRQRRQWQCGWPTLE